MKVSSGMSLKRSRRQREQIVLQFYTISPIIANLIGCLPFDIAWFWIFICLQDFACMPLYSCQGNETCNNWQKERLRRLCLYGQLSGTWGSIGHAPQKKKVLIWREYSIACHCGNKMQILCIFWPVEACESECQLFLRIRSRRPGHWLSIVQTWVSQVPSLSELLNGSWWGRYSCFNLPAICQVRAVS